MGDIICVTYADVYLTADLSEVRRVSDNALVVPADGDEDEE